MKQVHVSLWKSSAEPDRSDERAASETTHLPLWQVNLLRVGYFVMGGGLVVVKWPLLFTHGPWELKDGTVECMLVAISLLALMGLRYPVRMLPVLLFEVTWKLTWLAVIAAPLWLDDKLSGRTRDQAGTVLWVIIIIAVIPWRYVFTQFVTAPGDPWRRRPNKTADPSALEAVSRAGRGSTLPGAAASRALRGSNALLSAADGAPETGAIETERSRRLGAAHQTRCPLSFRKGTPGATLSE